MSHFITAIDMAADAIALFSQIFFAADTPASFSFRLSAAHYRRRQASFYFHFLHYAESHRHAFIAFFFRYLSYSLSEAASH